MTAYPYRVWCPDDSDRPSAPNRRAFDATEAALEFVSDNHAGLDHPPEIDVCVEDAHGLVQRITVRAEQDIRFMAVRLTAGGAR